MIYLFIISLRLTPLLRVLLCCFGCFLLCLFADEAMFYVWCSYSSRPRHRETRLCLCQKRAKASERVRGEDFGKSGIQSWVLSLASCFESINSKTTLLIDIIDSNNNVPLYILWLYRLNDTNNSTAANLRLDLFPTSSSPELMKKFLIN